MTAVVKTYTKGEEVFGHDVEVETYTFIVEVKADSQNDAKYGIELALENEINNGNEYLKAAKAFLAK